MNRMKMFFNYLFFRDMGNLGEGCLISAFIWLIIMLAIIGGGYFAYTKDHFMKVIQDNRITYNNVIQRG